MSRLKEESRFTIAPLFIGWLFSIGLVGLWVNAAFALGTSAGISITNTATLDYTVGSDPTVYTRSATDAFHVLEIIDVAVTWQDGANVQVNSPHANAALSFQVTNAGNGPEDFRLLLDHNVTGDDFNPTPTVPTTLWMESNGNIGLQTSGATADIPLSIGGNISLSADAAATVYVLSDIPGSLPDTQVGHVQLMAEATTVGAAGAAAGTVLPGAGVGGDTMVGSSNADDNALGRHEVSAPEVALFKSIIQMMDSYGGNHPYTSAQVTYRIRVDVTGSGLAEALVITDAVPVNTTFVAGSIALDGTPQTDSVDAPADHSDFDVTAPNTVTVALGDTVAPATRFIEFSVTID